MVVLGHDDFFSFCFCCFCYLFVGFSGQRLLVWCSVSTRSVVCSGGARDRELLEVLHEHLEGDVISEYGLALCLSKATAHVGRGGIEL